MFAGRTNRLGTFATGLALSIGSIGLPGCEKKAPAQTQEKTAEKTDEFALGNFGSARIFKNDRGGHVLLVQRGGDCASVEASSPVPGAKREVGECVKMEESNAYASFVKMEDGNPYIILFSGDANGGLGVARAQGMDSKQSVLFTPTRRLGDWNTFRQEVRLADGNWYTIYMAGHEAAVSSGNGQTILPLEIEDGKSELAVNLRAGPATTQPGLVSDGIKIADWDVHARISGSITGDYSLVVRRGDDVAAIAASKPVEGQQPEFGEAIKIGGWNAWARMAKMNDGSWYVFASGGGAGTGVGVCKATGVDRNFEFVIAPAVQLPGTEAWYRNVRMSDGNWYTFTVFGHDVAVVPVSVQ